MSINIDGKGSFDNRGIKNTSKLSDYLQPLEQRVINQNFEPEKIKYEERRFFDNAKIIDNITGRIKS